MLLRRADFGPTFRSLPSPSGSGDVYCRALDESDLTVTGEARSPTFVGGVESSSSLSQVYESLADSDASWRRGTSRAGEKCVRAQFGALFAAQGGRLESFRRLAFPVLTERTVAYRFTVASQEGLRLYLDVAVLKQSRAHVAVLLASGLTPMSRDEEVRLARTVARRMKTAMRGA